MNMTAALAQARPGNPSLVSSSSPASSIYHPAERRLRRRSNCSRTRAAKWSCRVEPAGGQPRRTIPATVEAPKCWRARRSRRSRSWRLCRRAERLPAAACSSSTIRMPVRGRAGFGAARRTFRRKVARTDQFQGRTLRASTRHPGSPSMEPSPITISAQGSASSESRRSRGGSWPESRASRWSN